MIYHSFGVWSIESFPCVFLIKKMKKDNYTCTVMKWSRVYSIILASLRYFSMIYHSFGVWSFTSFPPLFLIKTWKKDNYTCTSVMKWVRVYFIILASLSNFSKVNCMWSKNFMKKAVSPVKSLRNMSQHYELWHETRFQMIL